MFEIKQLQELIENEISRHSAIWDDTTPVNLYRPISYSLEKGGKRIRPLLVLLGYGLFGDHLREAFPAAMAIEVFHNFTLMHDDIMDKARMRRNQPAVHVRFGENTAILSGDVMAFIAYRFLLKCPARQLPEILTLFSDTAVEICEGQQMDMDFEKTTSVSPEEYLQMIRLKTAVLIACALKTGALLGNSRKDQADKLYEAGINLGMAFQLQDDLLDTFGEESTFGKQIGGDIASNKKTFFLVEALQTKDQKIFGELLSWIKRESYNREEKVEAVRNIYEQLNLREKTLHKAGSFFDRAMAVLEDLDVEEARKESLIRLCRDLAQRRK